MLVHAVHFPITKIPKLAFEGHLRKCACASPQDLLRIKNAQQPKASTSKRLDTHVSYITKHTHTHTPTVCTHCTYTNSLVLLLLLLLFPTAPGHGVLHDALPPHPQNGEEV